MKSSKKIAFYFEETNSKICAKCRETKDASMFFKHSSTSDGFHSWCKSCCKIGNNKSRLKLYSTFDGRIKTFLSSCKKSSQKRNQEFRLTRQDFLDMWKKQSGMCAYTGLKMDLAPNTYFSVSVERIDSNIGYIPENTILITMAVNRMKSNFSAEFFYKMCKDVTIWLSDENLERDVDFIKN